MVNPNLSSTPTVVAGFDRGLATVTGVGSVAGGDVLERGLAFGTGFGSVVVAATDKTTEARWFFFKWRSRLAGGASPAPPTRQGGGRERFLKW